MSQITKMRLVKLAPPNDKSNLTIDCGAAQCTLAGAAGQSRKLSKRTLDANAKFEAATKELLRFLTVDDCVAAKHAGYKFTLEGFQARAKIGTDVFYGDSEGRTALRKLVIAQLARVALLVDTGAASDATIVVAKRGRPRSKAALENTKLKAEIERLKSSLFQRDLNIVRLLEMVERLRSVIKYPGAQEV
jgi:hypothetical protein